MRTRFIVAAVLIQFLVLAWMAGEREIVYRTGRTVYLRTMPVDPRDYFRGDYVRLNYEISTIGKPLWRDGLKTLKQDEYSYRRRGRDVRIYTVLKVGDDGVAELQYVTDRKPEKDFFIRGRLQNTWFISMHALYGIEAYFVQQDKGQELEKGMNRDGINVPLEMKTAVSGSGLAVLKGYRWSPLGIGLTLNMETNRARAMLPVSADIKLLNASKTDLAIVDLPDALAFTLEPDFTVDWSQNEWRWVGARPRPAIADEHVKVLKPGEIHKVHINFSDPAWFVVKEGERPKSLSNPGANTWNARYRLVYRPPSKEECSSLKDASIIWHGSIASRAFSGGRID